MPLWCPSYLNVLYPTALHYAPTTNASLSPCPFTPPIPFSTPCPALSTRSACEIIYSSANEFSSHLSPNQLA